MAKLAPWMQLVARYGGDPNAARAAVVQVRGATVEVGRFIRNEPKLFVKSGPPEWVTFAKAKYIAGRGPVFELRETSAFESLLEAFGLLREVQLGDAEIDDVFVVRSETADALLRLWKPSARARLKALATHSRSVSSDGETVRIDVLEESAELPLLVRMVELVADLANG